MIQSADATPVAELSAEQCSTPYVAALDGKLIWVDFFFNVSSDLIGEFPSYPFTSRRLIDLLQ